MDIAAYIYDLLNREQFVYVPGLGTFLKRKTSGIYNQEQQCFYPPKNSIDFVAGEKEDQLLENYIIEQKKISSQAAKYFIEKFVDQLKNEAVTKNLPVKEVLFPAGKEALRNQLATNTSFNQENFGLPSIKLSQIKKQYEFAEKEAVTKQDYVENFYNEFSNNLPEEHEKNVPKRSTGFWAAAILLLTIGVLGCYTLYLYYPDLYGNFFLKKQSPAIVIKKPLADTLAANTLATSSAQTIVPTAKPKVKDTAAVAAIDPDLAEKSPYEVIGAAFKTLKGARTFLNQLKAKGMHRAKILSNTHGKATLVTFGSFKDKEAAHAALEKLHAKDAHSEAYIQHYIIK